LKNGESFNLSEDMKLWFLQYNDIVNKSLVETDPVYSSVRNELSGIFNSLNCEFILPFIHNQKIIGIMTMPERANPQQLSLDEIRFVNNLKNSVLIALLNSLMYQDLTNYKNNLELMVDKRTIELKKSHIEIETAMQTIRELAIRDELTGLFNRRYLLELLDYEKHRASRGGFLFCLAILDIDHFKKVNDVYGHLAGDAVLLAIATSIQMTMRNTDFCGRYGGEEFLLIYTQTNTTGALNSAERVRSEVENMRFPDIDPDLRITVSLGLTEYRHNEDTQKVISRADAALYLAKGSGRNRVEFSG
jgi:diguanylate cyclase (GGDEF)-like protein